MNFGENDKVEDLDDVKCEENEKEKFISDIQEYTLASISFGFIYKLLLGAGTKVKGGKVFNPADIPSPFPMVFNKDSFKYNEEYQKNIDYVENRFRKTYENYKKQYDDEEEKIDDRIDKISSEFKKLIRKDTLVNSFLEFSFYESELGYENNKNKNVFTVGHALRNANVLYDIIKIIGNVYKNNINKDDVNSEFRIASESVNTISMIYTNFYNYIKMLRNPDEFDAKYAAVYDPNDEIKKFYFDNKNYVDEEYDDYIKNKKEFIKHMLFNHDVSDRFHSFINELDAYIGDHKDELDAIVINPEDKPNKKVKKLKDPYEAINRFSHFNNYIHSYETCMEKIRPIIDEHDKWMKENSGKFEDPAIKEEGMKRMDEFLDKVVPHFESVVNTVIIATIGIGIIKGFEAYKEHFDSKNNNSGLGIDCTKYIFHEFILTYDALKKTSKEENLMTYINSNSKNTSFKGMNYEFQKYANVTEARRIFTHNIFSSMSDALISVANGIEKDAKEKALKDAERSKKREEKNKKKNKKNIVSKEQKENYLKKMKEVKKEKRVNDTVFNNIKYEYNSLINNGTTESNVISFLRNEGRYFIQVIPAKDTRVKISVLFNKKLDPMCNIQKFFEPNIIEKGVSTSVSKAHTIAMRINEDKMINLGEKWYYNQYKDYSLITDKETKITSKDINTLTISELCRVILQGTLESGESKIIDKIYDLITRSGIKFGDKDIVFKKNCKFDIKYFNGTKMSDYIKTTKENGNLNFFDTKTWFAISFELHYDLVNKKIEETEKKEEFKENKPIQKKKGTTIVRYSDETRKRGEKTIEEKYKKSNTPWQKEEDIRYANKLKRNKNKRK